MANQDAVPQSPTEPEMPGSQWILRGAVDYQLLLYRRVLNRVRLRLASWLFGGGWYGAITRLQLVHQRAKLAITPDGHVVLAECEALAEILYADVPGEWKLTVERVEP